MTNTKAQQFITGIRIIDVFAPIILGRICRLQWCEGAGANVLMAELIQRFLRSGGRHVVCAGCLPDAGRLQEWRAELKEYELDSYIADSWLDADPEHAGTKFEGALEYTRELLIANEDVLFVLLQHDDEQWEKRAISRFSDLDAEQHFVILTLAHYHQIADERDACDYTTRIVLDPKRARAGLYPPVDPVMSTFSNTATEILDARHSAVIEKARSAFRTYSDHDPDLQHLPDVLNWRGESSHPHQLAPLFRCCAQALYVATPYTGIAGESNTLQQAIAAFELAMEGITH